MKNLHIWLLVAIVIAGGAFMACKSSKKKTTSPTATTSSSTTEPSDTPSGSDGGNGDAPSLDDLAGLAATKEGKVAYSYTSTSSDGTEETMTFTLYSKPPDSRFDVDEGGVTTSIINKGGKTYVCSPDIEGCYESPTAIPLPFVSFFTDPATISGLIGADVGGANVDHSSKTVAGMDANCYSASTSEGEGEVCFSEDGLLLSIHGTDSSTGMEFTLEATSAEGSVSEADLELPYDITSLGD